MGRNIAQKYPASAAALNKISDWTPVNIIRVFVFVQCVKGRCDIIITKSVNILPPGPSRRFKRICELIQSMLLSNRDRHLGVAPQRRISADLCSDSSSSSYSSMDRVSPTPQDEVMLSQHSTSTASLIETIRSSKLLSPYKFISRQNINHWFFLSHHRFLPLRSSSPFLSDINATLFPL